MTQPSPAPLPVPPPLPSIPENQPEMPLDSYPILPRPTCAARDLVSAYPDLGTED